jgi:hypothetical protein
MAPGDSILLSRRQIDLLIGADFQESAPPELASRLLSEGARAVGEDSHRLALAGIHESLATALRTFAREPGCSPQDAATAEDLSERIEQLAVL